MLRQRETIAARRRLSIRLAVAGIILVLTVLVGLATWFASGYASESDARQIPGIRIENRETTLDLSGWQGTTETKSKTVKKERAISRNKFQIVRTHEHATTFIHIIGTTSAIAPEVICDGCEVERRGSKPGKRLKKEWEISFDISDKSKFPLGEMRDHVQRRFLECVSKTARVGRISSCTPNRQGILFNPLPR